MVHIFSIQPKQQRKNQITFAPSEAKNWSRNVSRYCSRDRYRERAGQLLANFFLDSKVTNCCSNDKIPTLYLQTPLVACTHSV